MTQLAQSLWRKRRQDTSEEIFLVDANVVASYEERLRSGRRGLARITQELQNPRGKSVLVLVDQFEEIFRCRHPKQSRTRLEAGSERGFSPSEDRNDAIAFVNLLLATAAQRESRVYVVLAMRSEFLGDCDDFLGLPEAINESQFLTPRMKRSQLHDAITRPLGLPEFNAR